MSEVDFSAQLKDAGQQVRQSSAHAIDLAQKVSLSHHQLVQDQASAHFDLLRSSLDIRDFEGVKSFWGEAARIGREGFERFSQNTQELFADQVKLAEQFGRQTKEHIETASKTSKRR